eukprot:464240_1
MSTTLRRQANEAMCRCLEQREYPTKSIPTADGAALECGLKHSNLENIPSDVVLRMFTFLDLMDYVSNVSLVCKKWRLTKHDILFTKVYTNRIGPTKIYHTRWKRDSLNIINEYIFCFVTPNHLIWGI